MELIACNSFREYDAFVCKKHLHPYNDALFIELNSHKCQKIHYLVFAKNNSPRLSLVLGETNGLFSSPFSAPFGGFDFLGKEPDSEVMNEVCFLLKRYLIDNNFACCCITLPPLFYANTFLSKCVNALNANKFAIKYADIDHFVWVKNKSTEELISKFTRAARKNYNKSLQSDFTFRVNNDVDLADAYAVIQSNRNAKGFYLRLTLEEIQAVARIIPVDSFLLTNKEDENVASAIVYHINPKIVQIIYWGHKPEFSAQNPMNYLSFKIFEYYAQNSIEVVDIGPSSSESIVFTGVCNFKESIGCDTDLKFTLELTKKQLEYDSI